MHLFAMSKIFFYIILQPEISKKLEPKQIIIMQVSDSLACYRDINWGSHFEDTIIVTILTCIAWNLKGQRLNHGRCVGQSERLRLSWYKSCWIKKRPTSFISLNKTIVKLMYLSNDSRNFHEHLVQLILILMKKIW